jgi:hypothetical protein
MRPFVAFLAGVQIVLSALQPTLGETQDPLLELLVKKGVIAREDMKEGPLTRVRLLELLVQKGILTADEAGQVRAEEGIQTTTKPTAEV